MFQLPTLNPQNTINHTEVTYTKQHIARNLIVKMTVWQHKKATRDEQRF